MKYNMRPKIWVDIETTGISPKEDDIHQISAIYEDKEFNVFIRYNKNKLTHTLPIPDDVYRYNLKAAICKFKYWLLSLSLDFNDEKKKPRFCGKNPKFDWDFLKEHINLHVYFHYTILDIDSVFTFMQDSGYYLDQTSHHLEDLITYFGFKYNAHNSLEDCKASRDIYNIMIANVNSVW